MIFIYSSEAYKNFEEYKLDSHQTLNQNKPPFFLQADYFGQHSLLEWASVQTDSEF